MLLSEKELYCGIFDSEIARNNLSKSPERLAECYEIELFHGSGGTSYVDRNRYPTKKGMLLCAKPGQIRHSDFPVRCSFIRFFQNDIEKREIAEMLSSMPDCLYISDESQIEELMALFSKLGACFISYHGKDIEKLRINSLFCDIVYRIIRLRDKNSNASDTKQVKHIVREAYEYINENFATKCTLEVIANAVNVSPYYLHNAFKESMGMTPYEYVLSKRITKAKRLIMAGEKTMLEIALETGFCSQSHFNKVFKASTGETPAEYRKNLLGRYL